MATSAYLDNACIGRVSPEIVQAAHQVADGFANISGDPTAFTCGLFDRYEAGRGIIEGALSLPPGSIAYVENTSHGLGMIANALPLQSRHNVLVCDLEFFSTVLCWKRRQEKEGFEVRPVKTRAGRVTTDDFVRAADKNTRAIVVSAVQEIDGYRVDIPSLAEFARSIGAYLIVDGIQEAGALNPHIADSGIDVYCAGGHKWLRNPFGAGFLYINPRTAGDLRPDFYGYFNAKAPQGGWGPYLESPQRTPFDALEIIPGAPGFETGATVNYTGAFCLIKSFEVLSSLGIGRAEEEVLARRRYMQEGLMRLGAKICGSTEERTLSGICTFNLPGGWRQEKALMGRFEKAGVCCSLRYVSGVGGVRLSAHYYTGYDEIDYMLSVLGDFLK